ncbi:MAG: TolC family protein [Crocinitomicaceae bacterium]|nr:TolC family protein [Crocinitomicaceae bacterium]MBK8924455.1 TolC family protein [Crocinitomicaceae bacterium]
MKISRPKLVLATMVITTLSVYGQDQTSFTLTEAETYGVTNNEKMKNAMLDIEAAQKKIWETTSIGLPQVSANGQFQNLVDIPTQVVDATLFNPMAQPGDVMEFQMGQKYSTSLTFNVSQLVFDGSYLVGLRFAKFYGEMAQTAFTNTENQVKVMVREAYYNVLVAEKNLALVDSMMVNTEKMWSEVQILEKNGMIKKEEVSQLELAYNRILATKQNATRQVSVARNLLKMQMGYDLDKELTLTETLDDVMKIILESNPALQEFAPAQNQTYILLDQQQQLDEFNLQNEKSKYMPSVGAFFTHSQNAYRNEFNFFEDEPWYPTTVWGVQVNIPITSSGQKMMRVQQAEIKLEQDQNNIDNLERTLEFQDMQLKAAFLNALDLLKIEEENIRLANEIYNNEVRRKDLGTGSGLKLTQLQTQVLTAQGNYIGAVLQLLSAKIQLDKLYNQ